MKRTELERLNGDALWSLHLEVSQLLQQRIQAEKLQLEERLKQLNFKTPSGRRTYPPVIPKYRNPDRPSETWAGRGKQPRWLVARLQTGARVEDFSIDRNSRHIGRRKTERNIGAPTPP
jgi:DNA-binding protein H-NS